ncbi:hypothetical protein TPHA_0A02010 [Tetrapisispora phaffii CBS 4417]|uniref:Uncharacterized protein n=1 Tax=Tetrapisispora phaffii (strain ATCC 24235 / CBS 4417 / NBRC 1672 / NRRL Y-8282 / UCD 70-5) TaxID=1071381 RepID=G8BN05_TETPH|nr:hypothetical protein TPHA_0A02010 [Tetrapisispora phaffii CBS 4417]CCE61283.1 hypothetical protein TPHA_0A02010 [Tetrapisispora phaffii CBS 4417]
MTSGSRELPKDYRHLQIPNSDAHTYESYSQHSYRDGSDSRQSPNYMRPQHSPAANRQRKYYNDTAGNSLSRGNSHSTVRSRQNQSRNISPVSISSVDSNSSMGSQNMGNSHYTTHTQRSRGDSYSYSANHMPASHTSPHIKPIASNGSGYEQNNWRNSRQKARVSMYHDVYVNTENMRMNNKRGVNMGQYDTSATNNSNKWNVESTYDYNPYSNNNDSGYLSLYLTPYQIQRKKMQSCFTFPNGEKFTPKEEIKRQNKALEEQLACGNKEERNKNGLPISNNNRNSNNNNNSHTNMNNADKPKTLVGSIARIFGMKKKSNFQTMNINTAEKESDRMYFAEPKDHQHNIPNFRSNQVDGSDSVLLKINDISDADSPSTFMNNSTKKIKFSNDVDIRGTWSSLEYERKPDIITVSYDHFIEGPLNSQDSITRDQQNQSPSSKKIKAEVNKFKETEMFVHQDSIQYTHYFIL